MIQSHTTPAIDVWINLAMNILAWLLQIIQDVNQIHRYIGQRRNTKGEFVGFGSKGLFH